MPIKYPCLKCGELLSQTTDNGAICKTCAPKRRETYKRINKRADRANTSANGRGTQWQHLSSRARKLQPFCLDCGSRSNLEADHLPSAWLKVLENKPMELTDVEVVCRQCNQSRGSSRPGSDRFHLWFSKTFLRTFDPSDYPNMGKIAYRGITPSQKGVRGARGTGENGHSFYPENTRGDTEGTSLILSIDPDMVRGQ